jgi:hypothetical protein
MMLTWQQLYILIKPRSDLIKPRRITTSHQNSVNTPPIADMIPLYWRHLTWRGSIMCMHLFFCRSLARAQCAITSEVHSVCSTINMPRKCVNSSDAFCYICGEVTFKSRRRSFTPLIKKCYESYFGCKVGNQDKRWAPHVCCVTCVKLLAAWGKGSCCMPFTIPMIWRQPILGPALFDKIKWRI